MDDCVPVGLELPFPGGAQGIFIGPNTRLRIGGADARRDGAVVGSSSSRRPGSRNRTAPRLV